MINKNLLEACGFFALCSGPYRKIANGYEIRDKKVIVFVDQEIPDSLPNSYKDEVFEVEVVPEYRPKAIYDQESES